MAVEKGPDFLIIGAQKSGTTSLYRYLIQHPSISPAVRKETHFFDKRYNLGMEWYLSQFPSLNEENRSTLTGEATPRYICHPKSRNRIHKHLPNAKLIAILRNPVDRAFSNYHHWIRKGHEIDFTFEEAIRNDEHGILSRGKYFHQLKGWFARYPKDQLLILDSESFFLDPNPALSKICSFLKIPEWELENYGVYNQNKYGEQMNPKTRKWLISYFKPYNKKLYQLLGQKFDWDK
jgi:hypothetical protein